MNIICFKYGSFHSAYFIKEIVVTRLEDIDFNLWRVDVFYERKSLFFRPVMSGTFQAVFDTHCNTQRILIWLFENEWLTYRRKSLPNFTYTVLRCRNVLYFVCFRLIKTDTGYMFVQYMCTTFKSICLKTYMHDSYNLFYTLSCDRIETRKNAGLQMSPYFYNSIIDFIRHRNNRTATNLIE